MPHRVANFLEKPVSNLKKTVADATRRRHSPSRLGHSTRERLVSYASSIEDDEDAARPPSYPRMRSESRSNSFSSDHHKEHHLRLSFPHFGRSSKESHVHHPAAIRWQLESPPIVLYGDAENSTGALVSGQLFLDVKEDDVEFESFTAALGIHVTQKRPFTPHCSDCVNQYTELNKWTFLQQPHVMTRGEHAFPFSVLLGGHLPASMDGQLVSIAYEFKAEAVPKAVGGTPSAPIRFEKVLDVKRSLQTPELPHHSVRVFPPTNIKASVHYPQVIHPIGSNTLSLKLDGISEHNDRADTIEYWKLKKLTWRLEETAKTVAPACAKHAPKDAAAEGAKKGVARSETRVIGEKTVFGGWKGDYSSAADSHVEAELEYVLDGHARFNCDTRSRDGSEVTHQLMVEMVVSQEWAPVGKPNPAIQTGVGRILRMHFSTVVTERGGIGISWDNEAPPIYQDVPPSPPAYFEEVWDDADCIDPQPLDAASPADARQRGSLDVGTRGEGAVI